MANDILKEIRAKIVAEKNKISLFQVAKLSRVDYKTVLGIFHGKATRISSRVEDKLMQYFTGQPTVIGTAQPSKAKSTPIKPNTAAVPQQSISPLKFYFSNSLTAEISATRARLKYLMTLDEAEKEYLKAVGQHPF